MDRILCTFYQYYQNFYTYIIQTWGFLRIAVFLSQDKMALSPDENPEMVYSIEASYCSYSNNFESDDINVIGRLRKPIRYSLNKLMMKSDTPQYKQVIESLVTNTVQTNSTESFKCLLFKKYQIQPLNDENQTALHLAHYSESNGIIAEFEKYLESDHCQESDYTDYVDINGLSHLHVACAHASTKLVENYCKNSDNINTRFTVPADEQNDGWYNGFTPLHFAMINFSHHGKEMVEVLVKYGADFNAVDSEGRTPLHIICSYDQNFGKNTLETMTSLIDSGANVNAQDAQGNTPLLTIFSQANIDRKDKYITYTGFIESTEQKLKLLLASGADVNMKNHNNDTVFHFAVDHPKIFIRYHNPLFINLLELIINANEEIDVNVKNNDGDTPLKLAISYLSVPMVQLFLKHDVDFTRLNFDCKTDEFFKYKYGNLNFKQLQKLLTILKILWDEGCILKPEDNLTVLKFLLHHGNSSFKSTDYDFTCSSFYMMCIKSPKQLAKTLNEFYYNCMEADENDEYDSDYSHNSDYSANINPDYGTLNAYYYCIRTAKVFLNKRSKISIRDILKKCREESVDYDSEVTDSEEIHEEIQILKSTEFVNSKSILDIIRKSPKESSRYFGKAEIDEKTLDNLDYFKGIVEGHMMLGMIRYCVIQLAYNCTFKLHSTPLPYDCYEPITNHLSNKDIFNLCLALLT